MIRKISLLLFLVLFLQACNSHKKVQKQMTQAFDFHKKGRKMDAIRIFQKIVKDYPKDPDYAKNLYNIASIYQELGDHRSAKKWYTKILRVKGLRDNEEDHSRGVLETHANHKHTAVYNIAIMYHADNQFDKALRYYKMAKKRYPYYNYSLRNARSKEIELAIRMADCHVKKGTITKAIATIFPYAITALPDKKFDPIDDLLTILEKDNRIDNFKFELDRALDNLEIRSYGIDLALYTIKIKVKRYQSELLTKEGIKRGHFYQELIAEEEEE